MDKLEAVNQMLDAIGEEPVSSLTSGLDDAESAERILDRVSRQVQLTGWYCNTERNLRLSPDINSNILVPANTLKIDTVGRSKYIPVVPRGAKLYNTKDQTFTFTSAIYVDLVSYYEFDDLVFSLQNYIASRAARVFQSGEIASISLDQFTSRDEKEAWVALLEDESEHTDMNVLTDNQFSLEVSGRFSKLRGL